VPRQEVIHAVCFPTLAMQEQRGRMAVLADPFWGTVSALIELDATGYVAIVTPYSRHDE